MRASWPGSMQSALAATLTTPEWWAMALAAFLIRGGIIVLLLPIIALPSVAGLITTLSPGFEALVLGTPTLGGAIAGAAVLTLLFLLLAWAGLAGSWIDLALVRDAVSSDELDLPWRPVAISSWHGFALRLTAHIPTLLALGYATVRVVVVSYAQLTSPSEAGIPVADRVIARVPDAVLVVLAAWLVGEAVGGLAVRRASAGLGTRAALLGALRHLLSPRGLATFAVTSVALLAVGIPFALAAQRAWEHVRSYLLSGVDAVPLGAAIVVLVATWVLGLSIIGAALAWRATAWTAEVAAEQPSS
ncbi:MAG TPA: hypothetical protein VJ850_10220 [Candidatus Limnocylindrales bacterium]|nr:hypothetical protein [Candidatus Limnocylindrales bacterium]